LASWLRARGTERRDLVPRRRRRRSRRRHPLDRPRAELVPTQLRLRRLRLRHLRRISPRHQDPPRRIRRAGVHRTHLQSPRHRPRHRGRLGRQSRRDQTRSTAAAKPRLAVAARKLGVITAELAVALSLSVTHKAIGFERRMPEVDFDALDLPPTGAMPVAIPGAVRAGGACNQQQPRHPTTRSRP
jgi:hypothetical protein